MLVGASFLTDPEEEEEEKDGGGGGGGGGGGWSDPFETEDTNRLGVVE